MEFCVFITYFLTGQNLVFFFFFTCEMFSTPQDLTQQFAFKIWDNIHCVCVCVYVFYLDIGK